MRTLKSSTVPKEVHDVLSDHFVVQIMNGSHIPKCRADVMFKL